MLVRRDVGAGSLLFTNATHEYEAEAAELELSPDYGTWRNAWFFSAL